MTISAPAATVVLGPGAHCEPVVSRVIAAVGAGGDLPIDRISDAQIVMGVIAREACAADEEGRVRVVLHADEGRMSIRIGPIGRPAADALLALERGAGLGPVIGGLSDEIDIEPCNDHGRVLLAAHFAA